jgi:hypothetical protein
MISCAKDMYYDSVRLSFKTGPRRSDGTWKMYIIITGIVTIRVGIFKYFHRPFSVGFQMHVPGTRIIFVYNKLVCTIRLLPAAVPSRSVGIRLLQNDRCDWAICALEKRSGVLYSICIYCLDAGPSVASCRGESNTEAMRGPQHRTAIIQSVSDKTPGVNHVVDAHVLWKPPRGGAGRRRVELEKFISSFYRNRYCYGRDRNYRDTGARNLGRAR